MLLCSLELLICQKMNLGRSNVMLGGKNVWFSMYIYASTILVPASAVVRSYQLPFHYCSEAESEIKLNEDSHHFFPVCLPFNHRVQSNCHSYVGMQSLCSINVFIFMGILGEHHN